MAAREVGHTGSSSCGRHPVLRQVYVKLHQSILSHRPLEYHWSARGEDHGGLGSRPYT